MKRRETVSILPEAKIFFFGQQKAGINPAPVYLNFVNPSPFI
jgi:hypothetical protein